MKILNLMIVALSLLSSAAGAAQPNAIAAYLQELQRVELATQPLSLEPLFVRAGEAQDAIMKIDGEFSNGDFAYLEKLSDTEYAALKQQMRGFVIAREGAIYAQPDPAFLSDLANVHGLETDQIFFRLHRSFWGAQLFPIYMKSHGDVSGCVRYGDGTVIELYEDWLRFAHRYPTAYTAVVQQTLKDLEGTVELGTCACGDAASVAKELRGFVRRYPQSPASPGARVRIHEIETDSMKLPVGCR